MTAGLGIIRTLGRRSSSHSAVLQILAVLCCCCPGVSQSSNDKHQNCLYLEREKKNHVIVLVAECSRGLFQVPWSMKSSSSAGTSLCLFVCKVLPVWISMSIFLPSIYLSDDIDQTKRYMILFKMSFSSLQAWEFCRYTKTIK